MIVPGGLSWPTHLEIQVGHGRHVTPNCLGCQGRDLLGGRCHHIPTQMRSDKGGRRRSRWAGHVGRPHGPACVTGRRDAGRGDCWSVDVTVTAQSRGHRGKGEQRRCRIRRSWRARCPPPPPPPLALPPPAPPAPTPPLRRRRHHQHHQHHQHHHPSTTTAAAAAAATITTTTVPPPLPPPPPTTAAALPVDEVLAPWCHPLPQSCHTWFVPW